MFEVEEGESDGDRGPSLPPLFDQMRDISSRSCDRWTPRSQQFCPRKQTRPPPSSLPCANLPSSQPCLSTRSTPRLLAQLLLPLPRSASPPLPFSSPQPLPTSRQRSPPTHPSSPSMEEVWRQLRPHPPHAPLLTALPSTLLTVIQSLPRTALPFTPQSSPPLPALPSPPP